MAKTVEMDAVEFVNRLRQSMETPDIKYAFFLGAGCSISSGIPSAGDLVRNKWLPKLKAIKTGDGKDAENWAKGLFPEYSGNNAASYYGQVIDALFLTADERQKEMEELTSGKDPGFGYGVLAQLISHNEFGKNLNFVFTTNFDDMVADALYLYTDRKPLVISHESLFGFVRVARTRPLVIKLHGDARLAPKNTEKETEDLNDEVKKAMRPLLSEVGLIFVGYGGNDKSISNLLDGLPPEALPGGVWWVGNALPGNDMGTWLRKRDVKFVNHQDFDELMLLIYDKFDLSHPVRSRFDEIFKRYFEVFTRLSEKVESKPEDSEKAALQQAAEKAGSQFKDWWAVELEASKYEKNYPGKAQEVYEDGIGRFPNSHELLGNYAVFLKNIRKDYNGAEEHYKRALAIDPNHANNLGNYAVFLEDIRKDYDGAEEHYKRALAIDPNDATHLGNYAVFLVNSRRDNDGAEEHYKRALAIDPNHATHLGNYALFLKNIRKDYDGAEEHYKRALAIDPNDANNLGNYALFLMNIRKDDDGAEEHYKRALAIDPNHANRLGNYALFLMNIRKDNDGAEEHYKRALAIDPNHATHLGNYALFLMNIRKDDDGAEEHYKRALAIDPNHANNLGNYAGFLLSLGREEGFGYLEMAISRGLDESALPLLLECYFYGYAHTKDDNERANSLAKAKELLNKGVRSTGWVLEENIKRARMDGHPNMGCLEALARVISEDAGLEALADC